MTKKDSKKYEILRTPVVAVMGHVNHGKTSLLDAIRGSNVQSGEAGGITQNTRAHQVDYNGYKITFIDTPGHEAFTEMRSRGSRVTDMVLLVVAADDGVQPQTKESINFAKSANVPVLVAINKIDIPGKNLEKLKQELSSAGLLLEEYGGDTMVVEVSAKNKTNLDQLLDSVLLLAELSNLKPEITSEKGIAAGFVLESTVDKNLGPVALVLLKSGQVEARNFLVSKEKYHRIRTLLDENQNKIEITNQADPIWISGLSEVLMSGDEVFFAENEKDAKEIVHSNKTLREQEEVAKKENELKEEEDLDILAQLIGNVKIEEDIKYLNIVLKASTAGTLEVATKELVDLNSDKVKIKVISSGVGKMTETDIQTAKNAFGIVIGFQVEPDKKISEIAQKEHVLLKNFEIIYELLEEIGDVLDSMEDPIEEEIEVARANVKQVFKLSNGEYVAGCVIEKGNIVKGYKSYILRNDERIEPNLRISNLKKLKNEVKEVKKGEECGIMLDPNTEIQENDQIICFKVEKRFY